MGIQMIASILTCAWIGSYLDEYFQTDKAYITLFMMLFGVMASIILLIRGIKRINNSKENTDQE